MDTKSLIQAELDRLDPDELDAIYRIVQDYARTREGERKPSLMSRLRRIQIDAPEDFAAQIDQSIDGDHSAR